MCQSCWKSGAAAAAAADDVAQRIEMVAVLPFEKGGRFRSYLSANAGGANLPPRMCTLPLKC